MSASNEGKQSVGGTLSQQPETDADEVFLRGLYAGTRAPELVLIPWDDAAKAAFLRQQFDAQRIHYRREFPQADFDVLLRGGSPLGRLYLDRSGLKWRLLDIALVPDVRGRGLGTALLRTLLAVAGAAGRPILGSASLRSANLLPRPCQGPVGIKPTAKKNNRPPGGRKEPGGGWFVFRPEGGGPFLPGVLYTLIPGTQADRATNTA